MSMQTEVYATVPGPDGGQVTLSLDVFSPPRDHSRRAAVLLLHAGGWRYGSREMVHHQADALAARGFVAVAVQYRLLDAATWPAPLDDVIAALQWTREHADRLGVDPGKVIVQGHSAGGHLALLCGALDAERRPAAIVAFYPPIGFYPTTTLPTPTAAGPPSIELDALGRLPSTMLLPADATEIEVATASPYEQVGPEFPPTLLHHATTDSFVHVRSSVALYQRLLAAGVQSELHTYAGRDHGFDVAPDFTRTTADLTSFFIERMVLDQQTDSADAAARRFPRG